MEVNNLHNFIMAQSAQNVKSGQRRLLGYDELAWTESPYRAGQAHYEAEVRMKAQIIYNPVAGQRDVRGEIQEVLDYLHSQGWQVQADETHSPGEATRYAQRARENGCQLVFAAGGDGTLNEVVNGLVGSDVAVGILPVGTGNVWAWEIGVPVWTPLHPHRLPDAVKALEEGVVYTVDVGRANGRYFLLWAGVGFDAQVVEEIEPQLDIKRRWGALAFAVRAVVVALSFAGVRAFVTTDERTLRRRVMLVLVSNTQSYGGGIFRVAPQARLDDGYLDVCIFRGEGFFSILRHFLGVLMQHHLRDPQVHYYRTRYLTVKTRKPMPVHVDGVPIGHTPLEVSLVPRGIKVVVPRQVRKSLFSSPTIEGISVRELVRSVFD